VAAILHRHKGARAPGLEGRALSSDVPRPWIELRLIGDQPVHFRHGGDFRPLDIGGASRDEQPGLGPLPARPADRLARMAHGFCRHRAAIDDDEVALPGKHRLHAFAFGDVQPAPECDDLGIHAKSLHSKVPRKLSAAAPLMVKEPRPSQPMTSVPPLRRTSTGEATSPRRIAAMAVALAPVPQARVSPTPRSHTRRSMAPSRTAAMFTFTRCGNSGSCSINGPSRARSTASASSTKKTACGLPTLTAAGFCRSSQPTGIESVSIA